MSSPRNTLDFPMPNVTIDRVVLERIRHYVKKCDTEVSGFGFATIDGANLHIMDARVVKQDSVGGAHTDINAEALNMLMAEWSRRDGCLVWWHSHVNMGVDWSRTDVDTLKGLGKNGMCVAMVFNKRNEQRCAMAFRAELPFSKVPSVIMIDHIPVVATMETAVDTLAAWDKELADSLPPPRQYGSHLGYGGYGDWNNESGTWVGGGANAHHSRDDFWHDENYWESAEEAYKDIDWSKDCHWSSSKMKWRKSYKQIQQDKAAKAVALPQGVGSASVEQDSLMQTRRTFALNDDDIVQYLPLSDEFELLNGIKVCADWYMKTALDNRDDPTLAAITGMSEADLDDLYSQVEKEKAAEEANVRP